MIMILAPNPVFPVMAETDTGEIFPIVAPKLPLPPHFCYYVYDWEDVYKVTTNIDSIPYDHYQGCFITDKEGDVIRVR